MVVAAEVSEPLRLTEDEEKRDDSDASRRVDKYVLSAFLPGWKSDPARTRGRGADPCSTVPCGRAGGAVLIIWACEGGANVDWGSQVYVGRETGPCVDCLFSGSEDRVLFGDFRARPNTLSTAKIMSTSKMPVTRQDSIQMR